MSSKNPKKFIARYITVELLKTKEKKKILKKMKEKQRLNYTEKMIQIADMSSETIHWEGMEQLSKNTEK